MYGCFVFVTYRLIDYIADAFNWNTKSHYYGYNTAIAHQSLQHSFSAFVGLQFILYNNLDILLVVSTFLDEIFILFITMYMYLTNCK